jgi:hypothetical protein
MAETLDRRCDGFEKEVQTDFRSWGCQDGWPYLRLIEVKTSDSRCLLKGGKIRSVLAQLAQRIGEIPLENTDQAGKHVLVQCRLVYNKIPGHNCTAEGCVGKLSRFPEYKALEKAIRDRNHGSDIKNHLELQTFIPLNFSRKDVLGELSFLEKEHRPILKALRDVETADFVRSIFGLIIPYYEKVEKMRLGRAGESSLSLSQIVHKQADTTSLLRSALEQALTRARFLEEWQRQDLGIQSAQARAESLLREARARRRLSVPEPPQEVTLPENKDVRQTLTILDMLCTMSPAPVFPTLKDVEIFPREDGNYAICTYDRPAGMFPVHTYLRYHRPNHHDRVLLILSFASFLCRLCDQGIGLTVFRSDQPQYRDWYFIRETDSGPHFLMGDLGALRLFNSGSSILAPNWIEGKVVATAIRCLYYGANDLARIHRSALFRTPWNDNVVLDIAEWLERSNPIIGAADLKRELEQVFEDETKHWPILCDSVDIKFIEDVVTAGDDSVVRLLSTAETRPTALLTDHSRLHKSVHYALWPHAQIGMISSSEGSVRLVNYTPYHTVRWAGSQDRDKAIAATMEPGKLPAPLAGRKSAMERQGLVFTGFCDPEHVRDVIANVFGLPYQTFITWLATQLDHHAQHLVRIPKSLQVDIELTHRQRDRVRELEASWITYQRVSESASPVIGDLDVTTFLVERDNLVNVLSRAKYELTDCKGLVIYDELLGRIGSIVEVQAVTANTMAGIQVRMRRDPQELPKQGLLRMIDAGLDASIKADEAVVRELEFALQAGPAAKDRPVRHAWDLLQPILRDEVKNQLSKGNSAENIQKLESTDGWLIVTGAAGTGKTQYVAKRVESFLDSVVSIAFPPPRVLVVAATHYALDNFLREFKEVTRGRIVPYRYVSPSRLDTLLEERRVDPAILHESRTHYQQELQVALGERYSEWLRTNGEKEMTDRTGIHDLERRLAHIKQTSLFPTTVLVSPQAVMIPSHERFRFTRLHYVRRWPARELDGLMLSLEQRMEAVGNALTDLDVDPEASHHVTMEPHSLLAERNECFSAPLVATTLGGMDHLPDVPYDMIVFEEASQIGPLKVLKTLSKVLRANGAGRYPQVIFSGDPNQLAPYDEPEVNPGDLDVRSILDLIDKPAVKHLTLTTQHRMNHGISNLVSALFYPGQTWDPVRAQVSTGGVWWIDTTTLPAREKAERRGRSQRNRAESVIVQKLVVWLRNIGVKNILVVSPYMAQTYDLTFVLDDQISIRTVDGCQGRTAEAVVVSLVSPKPFAVESRRLNVAMSRASDYLFLVGDLEPLLYDLIFSASSSLTRLPDFFGPAGQYRERVIQVPTIDNWEFSP